MLTGTVTISFLRLKVYLGVIVRVYKFTKSNYYLQKHLKINSYCNFVDLVSFILIFEGYLMPNPSL